MKIEILYPEICTLYGDKGNTGNAEMSESDCLSTRFYAIFQMLSCHVRYSFGIF